MGRALTPQTRSLVRNVTREDAYVTRPFAVLSLTGLLLSLATAVGMVFLL